MYSSNDIKNTVQEGDEMLPFASRAVGNCFLLAAIAIALAAPAKAADMIPVDGNFDLKDEKPNISGMDCMGSAGDAERSCLLVDDELKKAQFATLYSDRLVVGDTVSLFRQSNPPIVGVEPAEGTWHCTDGKDSGEMDGEGIARDGSFFYVMGSHGCAKNGEFRPETFVLARVSASGNSVERTYRLSEALLAAPETREPFGRDLDDGGLSFEGIAARDGRLFLAARVPPVTRGGIDGTLMVAVDADPLFVEGGKLAAARVKFVPLGSFNGETSGEKVPIGFRDLEALPDGRFVALTGPMPDGEGLFQLRMLDADFGFVGEPFTVTRPTDVQGSPEAIEWLGDKDGQHRIMVLSDGAPNGAPFLVSFKE